MVTEEVEAQVSTTLLLSSRSALLRIPSTGNQMSNLYLYTFLGSYTIPNIPPMTFADRSLLATLLLLLAISVLIVGRSIFVRRRARRVMEEAIRNGTSPTQTRPAVKLGDKPVLFDVYTTKNGSPPDNISVTWADLKVRLYFSAHSAPWTFTGLLRYRASRCPRR